MVTIKHNFSTMFAQDNPLVGMMLQVNETTIGLYIYLTLVLLFIVAFYVMLRKTQDTAKSMITSLHMTTILSLLLYYAGKVGGFIFVSDFVMLGLVVVEIISITTIYFVRSKGA